MVTIVHLQKNLVSPMNMIDKAFFNTIHSVLDLDFSVDGKHPITLAKIQKTSAPYGLISDPILNGYLHLLATDLTRMNSMRPTFHIFDTLLADCIRDGNLNGDLKPPVHGNISKQKRKLPPTLWVPEVSSSFHCIQFLITNNANPSSTYLNGNSFSCRGFCLTSNIGYWW